MPIMSVVDRSDARTSARVLARTALRCINGEIEAKKHKVELASLFRLLNAFRSHEFQGYAYVSRLPRGPEALTLQPSADRHVLDLSAALKDALDKEYGQTDYNKAIEEIDLVIRDAARSQPSNQANRERTVRFLDSFIEHLVVR